MSAPPCRAMYPGRDIHLSFILYATKSIMLKKGSGNNDCEKIENWVDSKSKNWVTTKQRRVQSVQDINKKTALFVMMMMMMYCRPG